MENLNLAELLRDCPTGMDLDSTVFDNITFDYVNTEQNRIYCKIDNRDTVWFTAKGCINLAPSAKCVIFPKGKTTWEGFHKPFEDGDILATNDGKFIAIIKKNGGKTYCCCHTNGSYFKTDCSGWFDRLATEEEKQKLFQVIKENDYKWNAETKTLEKLVEPIFKVGDRIRHKTHIRQENAVTEIKDTHYILDDELALPFISQDQYELVPNKFDITTLEPFDKVLVRDFDNTPWEIEFFSRLFDGKHFKCLDVSYTQCIPYEGNHHLLGTTNDCDDFYKTWEK